MAISAGDLNRRITIERDLPTRDGHGNDVHNWQPIAKMWAAYTPGSGTERRQAAQDRGAITAVFSVRKTATLWPLAGPRVDPNCRIVFQGLVWDIHSIALIDLDGLDITATTAYEVVVRPLSGAIASSSSLTGTITVAALLAGTIAGGSTVAGALTIAAPLAGALVGAAALAGALTVTAPLAAAVAGVGALTGALTVTAPLAAAAAGVGALTGALTVTAPLTGAVAGVGRSAGALTVTAPLLGAVAGLGAPAGTLTVTAPLAGAVVGSGPVAGTLSVTAAMAGAVAAVAALTGALTNTASPPAFLSAAWVDNGNTNIQNWSPVNGADLSNCSLAIVAVARNNGSNNSNIVAAGSTSGWTALDEQTATSGISTRARFTIFYKVAPTNNETLTIGISGANIADIGGAYIIRLTGVDSLVDAKSKSTSTGSTNPDPPSLDPGAVRSHLYLALAETGSSAATSITAGPSGYSNFTAQAPQTLGGGTIPGAAFATKAATGQVEDPGTFTAASAPWATFTLAAYHS